MLQALAVWLGSIVIVLSLRAGTAAAGELQVPWIMVAELVPPHRQADVNDERVSAGCREVFAGAVGGGRDAVNYAWQPRRQMVFEYPAYTPAPAQPRPARAELFKWQDASWKRVASIRVNRQGTQLQLVKGIAGRGLFRIRLSSENPDPAPVCHAIVCDNWKKDLLAFCRGNKQYLELNPDPQLVRSCLAVSHWDRVMQLISDSPALTDDVLAALQGAIRNAQAFAAGDYPICAVGLNKLRLKRFPGAVVEEFVLFVPETYDAVRAWPLVLHCDNRRFAAADKYRLHTGYVDLWWHTVTDKEVNWKGYQAMLEVLRRSINIDADRIYVTGECGTALAAVSLALNYPDHWAECCVSLGNTYRHLAGNAFNLPFILCKGGHNEAMYNAYFDFAVKCFQYHRCPHFKGSAEHNAEQLRGAPLPQAVRERAPRRVSYTIESLQNPRAYWVVIEGREDENQLASLEARVDGQTIEVTTKNVDAYSLDLALAPVDANAPVRVVENGQPLEAVTGPVFTRRSAKYQGAERLKTSVRPGPLADVFTDAYAVVWGDGTDTVLAAAAEQTAQALAGQGPCFPDTRLPEHYPDTHNLVLVGTAGSNRWLRGVDPCLPVRIVENRVIAGRRQYEGRDLGYMLVYPSPFHKQRYVAVFSATSAKAMASLSDAYAQMQRIRPADVGIFEVKDDGGIKWHVLERFNSRWDWHEQYDRPMLTVRRQHPSWQWQQWLAHNLRKHLDADVVIQGEPFLFDGAPTVGELTYRDLFNTFRNYWMIEVDISGADLRNMAAAPLTSSGRGETALPVIDGLALIKTPGPAGDGALTIAELQSDRRYRAVMSEECIKGEPLGVEPQHYEIAGEAYLVPLLAAFLEAGEQRDVDAELDRFTFRIF